MTARKQKPPDPDITAGLEDGKPYGYVLILRALARAAITCGETNSLAALKVLCVLAEYCDQDGMCRVGQDTIAARLGISRQAVNRQLKLLEEWEYIVAHAPKTGATKRYGIDTDGLEDRRYAEYQVKQRRENKAEARRREKRSGAGGGAGDSRRSASDRVQHPDVAGDEVEQKAGEVQPNDVAGVQRLEVSRGATLRRCTKKTLQKSPQEIF